MRYAVIPIKDYLEELAAKSPVPGGGSAAALFGATGCALMEMVLNYSDDKSAAIIRAKRVFKAQRANFIKLIDEDIAAYKRYSLNKNQKNLKATISVPLEVCLRSSGMLDYCGKLLEAVNRNLISDLGCAVYAFASSFKTARLNVDINVKYIRDERFARSTRKKISASDKKAASLEKSITGRVNKIINKPWQKY